MNFLPLVITFLLIFGALSISFMSGQSADKTETLAYQGRLRALRHAYNEVEEHRYDRKKVTNPNEESHLTPPPDKKNTPEEKLYFRVSRMGAAQGAINLAQLTEKNADNEWLKEKIIEYLVAVYGNTNFIQELKNPHWARELLDFLIIKQKEALKEKNAFLPLSKLCLEGPLQKYFPRLIRGTNSWDPETGRGYLPLERCITFNQKHKKPINIHFANPTMLIVLFGKDAARDIENEEWPNGIPRKEASKQSNYSLKIDDLKKLLGDRFDERLARLLDDKYRRGKKYHKRAYDPDTFISAQVFEDSSPE